MPAKTCLIPYIGSRYIGFIRIIILSLWDRKREIVRDIVSALSYWELWKSGVLAWSMANVVEDLIHGYEMSSGCWKAVGNDMIDELIGTSEKDPETAISFG
jgi:hypothetical protein